MYEHNGQYSKNNPTFDEDHTEWKAQKIFQMIKKNNLDPKSICDIGCGSGGISWHLQKYIPTCSFTGYDINPDAINLCLSKENRLLTFKCINFLNEKMYSDIILLIDVIEHLENYHQYMRDIKFKSEYKILHIPLENFAIALLYPPFQLGQIRKVGHLHFFSKEVTLQQIRNLGYEIIDIQYTTTMEVALQNWGWKDKLLSIPRRLLFPFIPDLTVQIFGGYSILLLIK
jgi:SAM-dependent methyltransferase